MSSPSSVGKVNCPWSLRGRSHPLLSISVNTNSNQRGKYSAPVHRRRVSKVRKSLNFDNVVTPNTPIVNDTPDNETQVSSELNDDLLPGHNYSRSSPDATLEDIFWLNPTPSQSSTFHPLTSNEKVSISHQHHYRRSPRLILKSSHQLPSTQSETDSGFEPSPPSSQNFSFSGIVKSPSIDGISIHSDYGTSSETSFSEISHRTQIKQKFQGGISPNFGKRLKLEKTESIVNHLSHDLSSGYVGDTDDNNIEESHTQPWDSDDSSEWVIVLDESHNQSSATSNYISIGNFPKKPCVKWLNYEGMHVLIPLEGYDLPPDYNKNQSDTVTNLKLPSSSPYRMRRNLRRRRCRLKPRPSPPPSPFNIRISKTTTSMEESFLKIGFRVIGASDVITLQPLGTKFCELYPALVSITLNQIPVCGDEIYCLYSKSSDPGTTADDPSDTWSVLHDTKITMEGGKVSFEIYEFYSFVVVIREAAIDAQKSIRTRIGGKLYVPEIPWIEINFPKGLLQDDILAKVHVFLDTEMSLPDYLNHRKLNSIQTIQCLAAPIVMLEPHEFVFLPDFVTIDLPVPNYEEIISKFGSSAQLLIYQSCTTENEPTNWEQLDIPYTLRKVKHLANRTMTVISFKVSHFSFFRIVWDLITATLYESKVGMSSFFSFVSFAMKCQANMEEAEDNRFGLEVTCYRSDKKFTELTNYRYKVGASTRPKFVRPGRIFVRLKSSYFDADEDAGEDPELLKQEADFRGRDFEVQYCCKFKKDKPIDRGPFGKVIVNREKNGKPDEMLFEFNLQKSGHESEKTPNTDSDRWSIVALQELASSLFITEGDNWKTFANHIGFTKQEVKTNFKNSQDPFLSIVNLYQHRGGTPDEFVNALYSVNRELKINGCRSPASSHKSRSSTGSSGRGSLTYAEKYRSIPGSDSDTSGTHLSQDSGVDPRRAAQLPIRKRSNPSINRSNGSSKKRKRLRLDRDESEEHRKSSDSNRNSDSEEENKKKKDSAEIAALLAGSAKSEANASSINHKNDLTKLETSFLWEISSHMDGMNWKSLGRTLSLEESMLLNIESQHRLNGIRELFYQMLLHWKERFPKKCTFGILYSALRKEGMNQVAKAMINVRRND